MTDHCSTNFEVREQQIKEIEQRHIRPDRLFVLLLGPSAIGKSAVIAAMQEQSRTTQFQYVRPVTTRELRPGEKDKDSVTEAEFDRREREMVRLSPLIGSMVLDMVLLLKEFYAP
ncbi:hypothetical protein IPL68_05890 [Candidatus Saccharibacteria bacterium]|nr:MAG: hypothetical protein IPL68_05890 [Candidatus Saccharibacteria bacterium]